MRTLSAWAFGSRTANGLELLIDGRDVLRVSVLDDTLFRISVLKGGEWRLDRTWTVAPCGSMPIEGRSRDDLSPFDCPDFTVAGDDPITIETRTLRLSISRPFHLSWAAKISGTWVTFAADRTTGAAMLGRRDNRVAHFMEYRGEQIFGLGEKSGPLDRAGRRFEMRNLDALGYNARTTDPLYKHVPFAMTRTEDAGCWSIFYDNLATCWFDLAQERDNYHKPFRSYRAEDGDLDYYVKWAPDLLSLTKAQVRLTGGTAFPPRWSLGYSGSTMSYTDKSDAQDQLVGFLDKLKRHDIPCDSFHMSSGYSTINGKRYVFNWNRSKVPDPPAVGAAYARAGVQLIANIKPCLLHDHPRYKEAADQNLFVRDSETGDPEISPFWDDNGSHLDMSNPKTLDWWRKGVREQLLENGIGSTWNDNNEYGIWDDAAQCDGFGKPVDISLIRPLMSQFMCRASDDAQRAHKPGKRPYLITRSGAPGIQRLAQTWTGDNTTSWETLRWNIRMGLGLSLSGFFNVGHDVGGFVGPCPEPELLVRWVQNGIFHPRFSIHSWNPDGDATEPWMYPEVLPLIRDAIRFRYRLLPYLYTCLWKSVTQDEPMLRPTFLDHPDDPKCHEDTDDFMLGSDLLIATVVEPAQTNRSVYLPINDVGWWDYDGTRWYPGGTTIECPVTQETIPMFVRAGAVVPIGLGAKRATPDAETGRELRIYPFVGDGVCASELFEDDGESISGPNSLLSFEMMGKSGSSTLTIGHTGGMAPVIQKASVFIAGSDSRVELEGAALNRGDLLELPGVTDHGDGKS